MEKKKKMDWRAEVLRRTTMCLDRASDPNTARELRHLRRSVEEKGKLDKLCAQEMLTLLFELQPILAQNQPQLASVYITRLRDLVDGNVASRKRGGLMGLFSKVKQMLTGDEKGAQNDMLKGKERDAELKIFEMEKRIAEESAKRQKLLDQLRDKAKACASLDPQSYEYQLARQQAIALKPRINAIEQTINLYAKQLENSAKYQALVSSGQATIDLKKMMPDPAEATALVDMIVEQTQDVSREIEDFGAAIDEGLSSFSAATNMNVFGADDEFEKLVAQERASSAAQQAAEQAAQKAAEDEIQKAVDAEIAKAAAQAAVKEEPQAAAQESAQDATDDAQEVCE